MEGGSCCAAGQAFGWFSMVTVQGDGDGDGKSRPSCVEWLALHMPNGQAPLKKVYWHHLAWSVLHHAPQRVPVEPY